MDSPSVSISSSPLLPCRCEHEERGGREGGREGGWEEGREGVRE